MADKCEVCGSDDGRCIDGDRKLLSLIRRTDCPHKPREMAPNEWPKIPASQDEGESVETPDADRELRLRHSNHPDWRDGDKPDAPPALTVTVVAAWLRDTASQLEQIELSHSHHEASVLRDIARWVEEHCYD